MVDANNREDAVLGKGRGYGWLRGGLELLHRMPSRCGHCLCFGPDVAADNPTAERTVTRGSNKKTIDKGDAIRERPLLSGIEVP
jgi:hypothetical protein